MTQHDGEASFGGATRPGPDPWMPKRSAVPAALLPGYRDFVAIARSDTSEVYRAHQDGLDRPVAIKVLLLDDEEALARFEREVVITVQLGRQHPHIVNVIDTGATATGRPCIVMEYYDLGSLHDRLRAHGPLDSVEVLTAGTVVADALSFAHQHGVLHRDVKPQNILVLPTSYVVADFGIARRIDAARTSSVEWFSFRHASPEMLDGEPPSVGDDIWSLGSTLFTLLDGRPPFAAEDVKDDTALAYMKRVRTGQPRQLSRPDVAPGLVAVIDRCLCGDPADRFPDAAALHAELTALGAQIRAWAPADAATPDVTSPPPTDPDTTAYRASAGMTAERPQVVPIRPGPLVPQPPPVGASPATAAPFRASTFGTGSEPTGPTTGPGDPTTGPGGLAGVGSVAGQRTGLPDGPAAPARSRSVRRILVVAAAAIVLGGVLGIGGAWLNRSARTGVAQPDPSPGATSSAAPNVNSTRIAPTITQLDGRRTGAFLRWQDPSRGEAQFIVVRVIDGAGDPLRTLPPGTTQVAIEGLDPASAPYCFLVIAVVGQERGVSAPRCAGAPA